MRVVELPRVAVGAAIGDPDIGVRRYADAAQLDLLGHPAPAELVRAVIAEKLLDRRVEQARVGAEPLPLLGLAEQRVDGDAQQIGRAHSELQSLMRTSYAVLCLTKKTHIHIKE